MVGVEDLTPAQRGVYDTQEQRVLVLGGPGSGKTLVALLVARRIVDEDPTAALRVLFLTFSRTATNELIRRAPSVFAGADGDRLEVTTFHGFAVSVVDAFRRFAGGPIEPVTIATREETELGVAGAASVEFDALIPDLLTLFDSAPWVLDLYRSRYAAIVCDEFQDTRDEQFELLTWLADGRRLICLADPDQMIFDGLPGAASIAQRIERFRAMGPAVYDLGAASHRDPTQVIPAAAAALRQEDFQAVTLRQAVAGGRVLTVEGPAPRQRALQEVEAALTGGAASVGVFFATNRQVNEFADDLRQRGLEHEIAGLSHASGEAETAAATLATHLSGGATWNDVLRRLGVFLASTVRGQPGEVPRQLVSGEGEVDAVLAGILRRERERIAAVNAPSIGAFLDEARSFWGRAFRGRGGQRLWELGLDDLISESLELADLPLDEVSVAALMQIASRRRGSAALDGLPANQAPVLVMNIYQVKGRQMDVSVIVREPRDREPQTPGERRRFGRLVYVAVSRARERAVFVLPAGIGGYFAPYRALR